MTSRSLLFAALVGALVAALVAMSVTAVVQTRRAAAEAERADELRAEVADLERRVAELEAEAAAGGGGGLDGLLGGLLGEDGGELSGLLDGLLGGDTGLLDGLLSGVTGEVPGARCLAPAGGGGLGGLLDGGLGGLFGGGSDATPTDPDELVTTISGQVEELRELDLSAPVEVEFLADAELRADLERLLDEGMDRDELAAQEAILTALRAIPASSDLEQLQRDLLGDQVAGYYDPDDGRLVVRTPDDGQVRPLDQVTIAHEVGHALVDQAVGLPDLDDDTDADAALARLAVVEGDATLLMNRWTLEHLSLADQVGMLGAGDLIGQQQQLAAFPHHLQRELVFPYTAGLDLVCDRYLDGGWRAIDDAYDAPPATTVEVLFPDRGPVTPAAVPPLAVPTGGTLQHQDTFGAAPLLWLFEAPGGDTGAALDAPADRAGVWSGGQVRLWDVAGDAVVGLSFAEAPGSGPALCDSMVAWYDAADPTATRTDDGEVVRLAGADATAAVRCDDAGVRFAVASDEALAVEVVGGRR